MNKIIIFSVLCVIIIILLIRAYQKQTIEIKVEAPPVKSNLLPHKRKFGKLKTRSNKEDMCREIFENIFEVKFKSCRPNFLKNPATGRNLELDGYNQNLKIAFEYNGEQHYNFPNTFHKTKEEFEKQVARDKFKQEICNDLDIILVSIPYTIEDDNLATFIITELTKYPRIRNILNYE